jgi:uncharacterized iron-regulated protein
MRRILSGVLGSLLGVASAGCQDSAPPARPPASQVVAPAFPPSPSRIIPIAWRTTLDRDHPLVGRIWDVRAARFVDEGELRAKLHGYVLLGEKHDNADHHQLQARLLRVVIEGGRAPVVAFEMFDVDDQQAIDTAARALPHDGAALARAVSWEKSGWPAWEMYAPIADLALQFSLPIVATGLPRSRMRALMKPAGAAGSANDAGAEEKTDEGVPLTAEQEVSLRDELRESHCGHLPDARIGGMIRFQRARDASMANALMAAANAAHTPDAVLIAGTGHTRRDRGAGADLGVRDPSRGVVSVAFTEVEKGKNDPPAYAARWNTATLPFDFVWFTPRATDEDPCAAFAH